MNLSHLLFLHYLVLWALKLVVSQPIILHLGQPILDVRGIQWEFSWLGNTAKVLEAYGRTFHSVWESPRNTLYGDGLWECWRNMMWVSDKFDESVRRIQRECQRNTMRMFCSVWEGVGVNMIGGSKEYNGEYRSVWECCRNIMRVWEEFSGEVQRNMVESVGHYCLSNNQPSDMEIYPTARWVYILRNKAEWGIWNRGVG